MRSLVYFVAVTLDGRIAAPDGATDAFPASPEYLTALAADWGDGLPTAFHAAFGTTPPGHAWDTVVMGRATYQPAIDAGIVSPYDHLEQYVYSSTLAPVDHPRVHVVADDAAEHVAALMQRPGGDIWLAGGATLAGAVAPLIDRLVLKLNPVVLGAGLGLIDAPVAGLGWRLSDLRRYPDDILVLTYDRRR